MGLRGMWDELGGKQLPPFKAKSSMMEVLVAERVRRVFEAIHSLARILLGLHILHLPNSQATSSIA